MGRKIFKTGHSLAVTISSRLLKELNLKLGDTVETDFDAERKELVIRPGNRQRQLDLGLKVRPKLK